jgi:type III secretion protein L
VSALLKAGDTIALSAVRSIDARAPESASLALELPTLPGATAMVAPHRDNERLELEAAIAELRQRLADAESEADEREDAAFERGRREGEDLATGETEKRLELLRKGVDALQQSHSDRLAEYELLALQLARTALTRVFGDEGQRTEMVTQAITQRLASIKRKLVVRVSVSARDFRSKEELETLTARLPGFEIVPDKALDAGGCLVDLRLGTIDLGLPGQWQRLTVFLEELAHGESEE